MALLKHVRCRWASIIEPNTKFEPRWEIEAELNDEQAAMFADAGVRLKEDDGIKLIRFKRNVQGKKKDGTGMYDLEPPRVVDGNKKPFASLVGNGSLVNIAYELREWNVAGNSGVKPALNGVQVIELVEFSGAKADEFEEEGDTTTIEDTFEATEKEDIF